jgi:hypothetical protein
MRAITSSLGERGEAFRFAGPTSVGSSARVAWRRPFSDSEERMLASQLLEVASEAELEQVLRDLASKARRGVEPVRPTAAGPVEGLLKTVSKSALPSLAAAVGATSGGPERDATAGTLGSLLDQALRARAGRMTAADPDLQKCQQLFERYRRFVRVAGTATRAAAAAPPGVAPVAVAQKVIGDSARATLARTPPSAARARRLAEDLPAAAATGAAPEARRFAQGPFAAATSSPTPRATPFAAPAAAATAVTPEAGRFARTLFPATSPSPGAQTPGSSASAAAANAAASGRPPRRKSPAGPESAAGRVCTICELPLGVCQCRKVGRTGRWFRDGTSIVLHC